MKVLRWCMYMVASLWLVCACAEPEEAQPYPRYPYGGGDSSGGDSSGGDSSGGDSSGGDSSSGDPGGSGDAGDPGSAGDAAAGCNPACVDPGAPFCWQNACVECVETQHCPAFFECGASFNCEPMGCYLYGNPAAQCAVVDTCYGCDYGTGHCLPAADCGLDEDCCRGYTCNSFGNCEQNLNCFSETDCIVGSICNQMTSQCQREQCCPQTCGSTQFCDNTTCQCADDCRAEWGSCDPVAGNCCDGRRCDPGWPFCTTP